MEPTPRYGTKKAIYELVEELNLRFEEWMQDWPYEVASPTDIKKYVDHYGKQTDEDKKFLLMQAIIQATEEQTSDELFVKYWNRVKPILEEDFPIHEYTIYYWSCFDNENLDDCWRITTQMRKLWLEKK